MKDQIETDGEVVIRANKATADAILSELEETGLRESCVRVEDESREMAADGGVVTSTCRRVIRSDLPEGIPDAAAIGAFALGGYLLVSWAQLGGELSTSTALLLSALGVGYLVSGSPVTSSILVVVAGAVIAPTTPSLFLGVGIVALEFGALEALKRSGVVRTAQEEFGL